MSQASDDSLDGSFGSAERRVVPWEAGAVGERIFDCGVRCCVVVLEHKIFRYQLDNWRVPLEVGILFVVIDEE